MKSKPHGFFPFYCFLKICQVMAIKEGNQQIISNTTLFSKYMHYIYFVSKQNLSKMYVGNEGEPWKLLKLIDMNSGARPNSL